MKSFDGTGTDRTILSGIHAYYEPEELIGKTLLAIVNLPPRAMMGIDSCGMLIFALHTEEGEEKLHLLMLDNHIPDGVQVLKQIKQTDGEARDYLRRSGTGQFGHGGYEKRCGRFYCEAVFERSPVDHGGKVSLINE